MIVVTGAAGFIGANILAALNARGRDDVLAVDCFHAGRNPQRLPNDPSLLDELRLERRVDRDDLPAFLDGAGPAVEGVVHMGACSDTTQTDEAFMAANNVEYTRMLWDWCARTGCPFIYASSAATYGDGSAGYDDRADPSIHRPLNLYGWSKHRFDLWALGQSVAPPRWVGLKYFNVYGPREAHKGRMASMVLHAFRQVRATGRVRLFQSHRQGIADGEQKRDFIHVGDAVAATLHFLHAPAAPHAPNGLYNVGTGRARSFADLARAVFAALDLPPDIVYIPMPADLRDQYQYFTQADTRKLRAAGFARPMLSLEAGVRQYVQWLLACEGSGG